MKMMKKMTSLLLVCVMLFSMLTLTSCSSAKKPEEGTVTRMTVDINPSVEFMIDDQGKVVSATALNDDGSILIVGEVFVGKTPEEAVDLMVTLAADTGYLVKGNVEADENQVKISVSGDTKYAKALMKTVSDKADEVLKKLDIEGAVAKAEALSDAALRQLALATALYSEEEIEAMDEKQLYNVLAQSRVETALLLTEDMRDAYYSAKEYKISFAESEATARVIEAMGGLYKLTHTAYKTALDLYSKAITDLDEFRYNMLVSPDSEYQKSLVKIREAKAEYLKQRNYTASLEVNGEAYAAATVTLQASEERYEKALAAYTALGDQLNASLENLIGLLRQSEEKLRELEATIFDDNIKEKLQEKAYEIEENVNAAKDAFFAEFEKAHADDIEKIESELMAKKQQLKDEMAA